MISHKGTTVPPADVEFAVLGSFRAKVADQWSAAPTRQVARVGTILAGWPGEYVERDRIAAGVWGAALPATVNNTLQVHVSHLRRLIGKDAVKSRGTSYILDVDPDAVDAEQFLEAVHEAARMCRRSHYGRALEFYGHALELWRGMPFPDVLDPDLEARRARLTELRDQARENVLQCRLELCRDRYELADVIADAKELVLLEPAREKGHVLLVRALAAADRAGEAAQAFQEAAEGLRGARGMEPSRELIDVHAKAVMRDDTLLPAMMRSVVVTTPVSTEVSDAHDMLRAAAVREAVVDIGSPLVTVIAPPSSRTESLVAAISHAISDDFVSGVITIDGAPSPAVVEVAPGYSEANLQAPAVDVTDLRHLAVIARCDDRSDIAATREFLDGIGTWGHVPTLILIAESPLGLPAEIVVDISDRPAGHGSEAPESAHVA